MRGVKHISILIYKWQRSEANNLCSFVEAGNRSLAHLNVRSRIRCFDAMYVSASYQVRSRIYPYPEPVYTGWSSVHWNATGMLLVDPVYTGIPLEKLSWNSPTLECHWRNLVESAPHWDATGETLTFAAYTGTPLEGLWQPTHAPTHIVKHAE